MRKIVFTMLKIVFTMFTMFFVAVFIARENVADAHSGGLNRQGCHAGSKLYHCHKNAPPRMPPHFERTFSGKSESFYSSAWCARQNGNDSLVLDDGTKPDCVLDDSVVEFDWGRAMQPYECVGQAIHYGYLTGKTPVCILIKDDSISDETFFRAAQKVRGGGVVFKCMNKDGEIIKCPQ